MKQRRSRLVRVIAAQQAIRRQAEVQLAALLAEREAITQRQLELAAALDGGGAWLSMAAVVARRIVGLIADGERLDREIEEARASRNSADMRARATERIVDTLTLSIRSDDQRKALEQIGGDHARASASGKSAATKV